MLLEDDGGSFLFSLFFSSLLFFEAMMHSGGGVVGLAWHYYGLCAGSRRWRSWLVDAIAVHKFYDEEHDWEQGFHV